jgi:UPF0271 protein
LHSNLVLDAGAFYAGTTFLSSERMYTTSLVLDEVRHIKSRLAALDALSDSGRLVVHDPDQESTESALDAAGKTGDRNMLSQADVSILALALQLGAQLVTDDYAVANVASFLHIPVKPATAGKIIQETRKWIYYCSACSRTFGSQEKICPLCGNKLSRKYRKLRSASSQ